ncbi:MAG: histidine phosphatase family protein [Saprospiraceae bacterium]
MRIAFFFLILFIFSDCSLQSRTNLIDTSLGESAITTIYLVRHAEKEKDGTRDPALNEEGIVRSEQLAKLLTTANIQNIYSTDYKRTRMTGMPLADQLDESIEIYSNEDEMMAILDTMTENTLIIGHSNTIPRLINRLLGEQRLADLKEYEYDKLFFLEKEGETYRLTTESF